MRSERNGARRTTRGSRARALLAVIGMIPLLGASAQAPSAPPAPATSAKASATAQGAVSANAAAAAPTVRLDGWTGVAARAGAGPIQLKVRGRGLSQLRSGQVIAQNGRPAQGIGISIGPGTDVERQLTLIVKAEALSGRYGLLGAGPEGTGRMPPFIGAFDLMVVDAKGGAGPLSAMLGLLGGKPGPGTPPAGTPPGGARDPASLAASAGLSTTKPADARGTLDRSSPTSGDPRLMTGSSNQGTTTGGTTTGGTTTGGTTTGGGTSGTSASTSNDPTVTVVSTSNDKTSSDGTAQIDNTITTTSSDGSWMVDRMTYTRDSKGNVTETQTVRSGDASGRTGYSHSCSGKCTPVPDKGGCAGDKACEKASAFFQAAFPLAGAMQKHFVESRFGSLGGDAVEPGAQGVAGAKREDLKGTPVDRTAPYANPNPEKGGSDKSGGPQVRTATPVKTGQPKPIDPQPQKKPKVPTDQPPKPGGG